MIKRIYSSRNLNYEYQIKMRTSQAQNNKFYMSLAVAGISNVSLISKKKNLANSCKQIIASLVGFYPDIKLNWRYGGRIVTYQISRNISVNRVAVPPKMQRQGRKTHTLLLYKVDFFDSFTKVDLQVFSPFCTTEYLDLLYLALRHSLTRSGGTSDLPLDNYGISEQSLRVFIIIIIFSIRRVKMYNFIFAIYQEQQRKDIL